MGLERETSTRSKSRLLETLAFPAGQISQGLANQRQFWILLRRLDDLEKGIQGMIHQLVSVPIAVLFIILHLLPGIHGNAGGE